MKRLKYKYNMKKYFTHINQNYLMSLNSKYLMIWKQKYLIQIRNRNNNEIAIAHYLFTLLKKTFFAFILYSRSEDFDKNECIDETNSYIIVKENLVNNDSYNDDDDSVYINNGNYNYEISLQ